MGYKFHDNFEKDVSTINFYKNMRYAGAAGGIVFAGTVWNPNYVKRTSFYARKFSIIIWGLVGFNLFNRFY